MDLDTGSEMTTDSAIRQFLAIVMITLLAGCTTPVVTDRAPTTVTPERSTQSIRALLNQAEQSEARQGVRLRLSAAELAYGAGNLLQTRQILALINDADVSAATVLDYLLLSAKLAIAEERAMDALALLNDTRLQNVRPNQELQIRIGLLRSTAYRLNRSYVASARERVYLDPLLTSTARGDNHEAIFSALLEVPSRSLASQASKAITSDLRGWLSLAAMTKRYQNDPLRQLEELNNWRRVWPDHPAAIRLPQSLTMLSKIVDEQPAVIALMLPFQGPNGAIGRAIRDGFLASHFDLHGSATLLMYDSSSADSAELMYRALRDGAELIIGPLAKDAVDRLSELDLDVPVLALNRTLNSSPNPNLYQFGLAPEDEIRQIVRQVDSEDLNKALVVYPDTEWGRRNFGVFQSEWEARDRIIVDSAAFSSQRDYSDLIRQLLNVDRSEERASELRRIVGERFQFTPRRRQDIDFVLMLADPGQARGINPTLERYYADDIPVYATSHVHEFGEAWIEAIDLNQIRFCDIPWKLTKSDRIQSRVFATWPAAQGQLVPFYALGVDAHRLYPRLQQLKQLPSERLYGATGILRLNARNVVERELMWAQFRDGAPVAAPMVVR
jgi:uncharacterized protein